MGACCGKVKENVQITQDNKYNLQQICDPTRDTIDYPLLSFKALLSKIKLKGCNKYKNIGIGIVFGQHHEFDLKSKSANQSILRWNVYHEFDFKATQLQLRKEFIELTFFQQGKTFIGCLKINLYLLATGPYHQDFDVILGKQKGARISFNLKIAQKVQIKLKVKQLEMFLNSKQFPGDTFAFNLKAIVGDKIEQSDLSYKFQVNYSEKTNAVTTREGQQVYMNQDLVIEDRFLMKKGLSEKRIISQRSIKQLQIDQQWKKISWSCKKSNQLPFIDIYVPLFDIHGASFILIFYSFNNNIKQFHSQCNVSFNKLTKFTFNEVKNTKTKKVYQQRQIVIQAKTWNQQKQTGLMRISADFILERHIRQIQLCVRTQQGILESSPVFGQLKSSFKVPQEIKQLQTLTMQIQNVFVKKQLSSINVNNLVISHVKKRILRIIQIIQSSNKQSKYENALLDGQRQLIQLGKRTKALLNEDIQQISELCWTLLIALIQRGEFLLAHMGYSQKQIAQYHSKKKTQYFQRKKQVALAYHIMLVQFLHVALVSFQGSNYESQRQFAQLFCSHAYFRIPKFRNQILTIIIRKDDPKINQYREQDLQDTHLDRETAISESSFSTLFDWESNFYKMIQAQQNFHKIQAMLMELLRTNNWEIRMKRREGAFFAFVRYWVNYIQKIVINSKHISWDYFPGYNKIIRSFMAEMKLRDIKNYPLSMKKAAASLLSNEKLINPFMLIIFRKTNLNDQFTVVKSLDLLSSFLGYFKNKDNTLPSTFDMKLINQTFKLILEGEAALSIQRVIILLYQDYKIFPVQFRIEFSLYLLTKRFFKLFCHWSSNVRPVFYHLIYIRIYNQATLTLQKLNSKDRQIYSQLIQYKKQIIERYRVLMVILHSIKDQQHKLKLKRIDLFEKLTYKKMRKKIQEKFKSNALNKIRIQEGLNKKPQVEQTLKKIIQEKINFYNHQSLTNTFKNIVSQHKIQQNQQVIVKSTYLQQNSYIQSYKKNLPDINNFKEDLVLIQDSEIVYVKRALEEYRQIIEIYTKLVQKSKQEEIVPHIKLTLSLDERQIRPQGILIDQQW